MLASMEEWNEPSAFWYQLLQKSVDNLELIMYTPWQLWGNRNQCLHQDNRPTRSVWSPPDASDIKLNVDAAYNAGTGMASLRVIVRDNRGKILLCVVTKERYISTILHAETRAVSFGLKLAIHMGCDSLIVESNSSLAVNEICKKGNSFWDGNGTTLEILRLAHLFPRCQFLHVRRQANLLAHQLAKLDCDPCFQRVRHDTTPHGICNPDLISSD
ncbi:hypothetical protein REPUB_Repub18cG0038700 [Reevesia pubescens]